MIQDPIAVLAILLAVLAVLFTVANHPWGKRFFSVVPLLVFAYFIPTTLSNTGIIPLQSPTYDFIKNWLLPSSLLLLTLAVDIPAILKLGRNVLVLFFGGTLSIMLGGPLAYLLCYQIIPKEMGDQAWKGLATLSGSWIGGGANYVAVGESVGISDSVYSMMIVIDVLLANIWLAVLLFFAANEQRLDNRINADRSTLDTVRKKIESFDKKVVRVSSLEDLFLILALAFGGTVLATYAADYLAVRFQEQAPGLNKFAWTVIITTALGLSASFTRLRNLDGAGASKLGTVFLYLLVASIGAKASFEKVFDAPVLLLVCTFWIIIHAATLLLLRRWLRAPIFFLAVGSQANIGGAASAPIVASAFHPSLAPVGALLGVAGYVVGTYAGLTCAYLMHRVYLLYQ